MHYLLHVLVEWSIELSDHIVPDQLAFRYFIEIVLDVGREIIIHDVIEVLFQIVGNQYPDFLRYQLAPFCSYDFCLN